MTKWNKLDEYAGEVSAYEKISINEALTYNQVVSAIEKAMKAIEDASFALNKAKVPSKAKSQNKVLFKIKQDLITAKQNVIDSVESEF
jgi:hypothetical protein